MALNHTIILGTARPSPVGPKNMLKVTSGGVSNIPLAADVVLTPGQGVCRKQAFVWNGTVYFPVGSRTSTSYGWAYYSHDTGKFEMLSEQMYWTAINLIPLKDKIGIIQNSPSPTGSMDSPQHYLKYAGQLTFYGASNYAISGNIVKMVDYSAQKIYTWAYPFEALPTSYNLAVNANNCVCEFEGKFYSVYADQPSTKLWLYEFGSLSPSIIGSGTTTAFALTYYSLTTPWAKTMFKFNGVLYVLLIASYTSVPTGKLFEINVTTGVFTDRSSWLPTSWQANPLTSQNCIFEIRNDIPNVEQVFLVRQEYNTGGWDMCEFTPGPMSLIPGATGGEIIAPSCGIVFDPDAKGAQINSAEDTVPSDYVEMDIEAFDLQANATIDIDPRFRYNSAEPPPYSVCTEKAGVGSEGKTGLSSAPTITGLSDMSDEFLLGPLDGVKWAEQCFNFDMSAQFRDQGNWNGANHIGKFNLDGALRFGDLTATWVAENGIGIQSRWSIDGEFEIDFVLANPENLRSGAGTYTTNPRLVGMVRIGPNQGYGFLIMKSTSPSGIHAYGFKLQLNSVWTITTITSGILDGDTIRIKRDATNAWSIVINPESTPVDITPAGPIAYSDSVRIALAIISNSTSSPNSGTFPYPGFQKVLVTGAGSVGKYWGGVSHKFCWDHIADLGTGKSGAAELYVDTQVP